MLEQKSIKSILISFLFIIIAFLSGFFLSDDIKSFTSKEKNTREIPTLPIELPIEDPMSKKEDKTQESALSEEISNNLNEIKNEETSVSDKIIEPEDNNSSLIQVENEDLSVIISKEQISTEEEIKNEESNKIDIEDKIEKKLIKKINKKNKKSSLKKYKNYQ